MASRILGMGDVLSIIEKAELEFSEEESKELEEMRLHALEIAINIKLLVTL